MLTRYPVLIRDQQVDQSGDVWALFGKFRSNSSRKISKLCSEKLTCIARGRGRRT